MPCRRGLPAPVFEDKRTAFLVKFYQRTPIEVPLADEEQRILAYVKKHGFIRRAEAQEQAEKRGAPVLEVEPARGGGSYVLQRVLCGKPPYHCAKTGGELHGPYWYYYCREDGKTKSNMWARTGLRSVNRVVFYMPLAL